jgi:hypothetical protein
MAAKLPADLKLQAQQEEQNCMKLYLTAKQEI